MARAAKKETALTAEEKLAQALVSDAEQPYPVPENWCWVKLGSISFHISDGSHNPPKDSGKGVPLLSATNIHDRIIDFEQTARWITNEEWVLENERTRIEVGDILLTIVATIGRVAVVTTEQPFALQRSVATIKPKINAQYLAYYFESPYVQTFMNTNAKGTAQKGFYLNSLENLFCAIAPLAEQQRIVDRIESLFAKLDEAKEKAQAVVDGFEERRTMILHKAFFFFFSANWRRTHNVSEASWELLTLNDVADYKKGPFGSSITKAMFVPKGEHTYKVYEQGNAIRKTLDYGHYYINEQKYNELKGFSVQSGDIIISCAGTIGEVYKLPEECEAGVINQALMRVRLHSNIEERFFSYYFGEVLKGDVIDQANGTAIKNIPPFKVMKAMEIRLPSFAEQKTIVNLLDEILQKEEQAQEAAEQVIDQIDTMKKAILARAFRGELGTNDPADESAEKLLKKYCDFYNSVLLPSFKLLPKKETRRY